MKSTEVADNGVLPNSRTSFSESMKESKLEPDSQTSPEESLQLADDDEPSPRPIHGWKWAVAAISIYTSCLIYGLDGTIAADMQAAIVEQFDNVERLTWIGTGYPLGSVCAILPTAALYSNFDLKIIFIASIILFEVGSTICGAAPSMNALIVGRTIAGVGGTGIFLGCLNYFSLCTTHQERGRYIAIMGVFWGTGCVLGPVVGGAFSTSSVTWRWGFYINLVVAAICAPVYIFYLPSVRPPSAPYLSVLERLKSLDWVGFIGGTGIIVSLAMVLTFAGSIWAWDDHRTIATFVAAGALLILTLLQQYFVLFTTREARMFPPRHLLGNRSLLLLNIVTAAASINIFVPLYYIPLYFAFVHGDSALMAAVRLLPYICFLGSMNMVLGALLPRISYYWALYMVGGALMTIGSATMFTVTPDTPIPTVYGFSILLGAGTGLIFNAGYTVAGVKTMLRTSSGLDVQRVISMLNLSQLGFQLTGLLIGGQLFQSLAMKNLNGVLSGQGYSEQDIRRAIAGTQSTLFASLSPAIQRQAIDAITIAMSRVYIISIAAGVITIISTTLMKKERLFPTGEANDIVIAGGA